MSDFCGICLTLIEKEPISNNIFKGGDIDIEGLYKSHILPHLDVLLNDESLALGVGGICEHCGLIQLSIKKEDNILFLISRCVKQRYDNIREYKIAIIEKDNELWYNENEIKRLYND